MVSRLPFLRREEETPGEEASVESTPAETSTPMAPGTPPGRVLMTNSASNSDRALEDMLAVLSPFLPEPSPPLPAPSVTVVSMTERALAVGNRRGTERRGSFAVVELRGGRLEAVVRFQLWGSDPVALDAEAEALHGRLLAARDELWAAGILRMVAEETSPAEHISSLNAWRKTTDYGLLYEFHYSDTDGAESLITRIPIEVDSEYAESTVVTDEMVRWDNQAAPTLEMRGGVRRVFRVGALSILAFLPEGWDGNAVTLSASVGGVAHERTFASVRGFRDAFDLEQVGGQLRTVELGGNPYLAGRMVFPNADFPDPIVLKGGEDIFRISYADERFLSENTSEIDSVVYLQVLS